MPELGWYVHHVHGGNVVARYFAKERIIPKIDKGQGVKNVVQSFEPFGPVFYILVVNASKFDKWLRRTRDAHPGLKWIAVYHHKAFVEGRWIVKPHYHVVVDRRLPCSRKRENWAQHLFYLTQRSKFKRTTYRCSRGLRRYERRTYFISASDPDSVERSTEILDRHTRTEKGHKEHRRTYLTDDGIREMLSVLRVS